MKMVVALDPQGVDRHQEFGVDCFHEAQCLLVLVGFLGKA